MAKPNVRKVVVSVTERDIKRGGIEGDACPVALAIKRASGRRKVHVTFDSVFTSSEAIDDPNRKIAVLPRSVISWVANYDNAWRAISAVKVKPFSFTLAMGRAHLKAGSGQ